MIVCKLITMERELFSAILITCDKEPFREALGIEITESEEPRYTYQILSLEIVLLKVRKLTLQKKKTEQL